MLVLIENRIYGLRYCKYTIHLMFYATKLTSSAVFPVQCSFLKYQAVDIHPPLCLLSVFLDSTFGVTALKTAEADVDCKSLQAEPKILLK